MSAEAPKSKEVLMEELKRLRSKIYEPGNEGLFDKMTEFADMLLGKYPDCRDYELFHFLIASTPLIPTKFDFPGDDSVEKFLREL